MLAGFERFMEQAVEGTVRRVFPAAVQPVQLFKAAARAMEGAQVIGLRGADVPNSYRLRLAPADFEQFADYSASLSREIGRYLVEYARERGLRPIAEPRVELAKDDSLRTGAIRADARFVDLAPERETELESAIQDTRQLRLADLAGSSAGEPSEPPHGVRRLWLDDRLGLHVQLDPHAAILRIGRASDNDVAIANQRVSRYHAQVRWVEATWLVYDLGSTNGTFVNEQPVLPSRPHALEPGATLRLGDHELQVAEDQSDADVQNTLAGS